MELRYLAETTPGVHSQGAFDPGPNRFHPPGWENCGVPRSAFELLPAYPWVSKLGRR